MSTTDTSTWCVVRVYQGQEKSTAGKTVVMAIRKGHA